MRTDLAPVALSECSTVLPLEVGVVDQVEPDTSTIPVLTASEAHALFTEEQETNTLPEESTSPQKYPPLSRALETGLAVTVKWIVGGVPESR